MAELLYKKNWDDVKKRFEAWWKCENKDAPIFCMRVDEKDIESELFKSIKNTDDRWLNIDKVIEREETIIENCQFPGEGYPGITPYIGPGSLGTFLGAIPGFDMGTVWYDPCFDDITKADINFDPNNKWWKWTLEFTEKALERGKGKYLVEMPDIVENLDTIAALVGSEPLLYHLYDYPEEIHRLQKKILPVWFKVFDHLYNMIKDEDGGMCFGFFGIYAAGKMAKLQCDFSAMISPDMFHEFVFPYLKEQSDCLDYALYHLDGPGELPHLDQILSIDSINAVQWVPLPGEHDPGDPCWDSLYRKILDAGKSIHCTMPVERVEPFIKRLGKKGVFIRTAPHTLKQAYDIIDKSYNW